MIREEEMLTFSSSTNVVHLKIHIHMKRTILIPFGKQLSREDIPCLLFFP